MGDRSALLRERQVRLPEAGKPTAWAPRLRLATEHWRERIRASRRVLHARRELAEELAAMRWLYDLNMRLAATTDLTQLFSEVLDATIALQNADFGHLQLYEAKTRTVEIVASRGLSDPLLEEMKRVRRQSEEYHRALAMRTRLIVSDVLADPALAPYRPLAARIGFRGVQVTPLLTSDGEMLGAITTHFRRPHHPSERQLRLTDLYARQVAELIFRARVERERRLLASLVENSTDIIGLASLDGTAKFVNATGRRLLGLSEEGLESSHVLEFVHPIDRARFEHEALPTLLREGRWEGEVLLLNARTGAPVPVLEHIFMIREPGTDRPVALAAICRDDSEHKRSEEALRIAQDELAHAGRLSTMGELIASISHEVSQPLAAIVTNGHACLHWLAHESPNIEEACAAVARILDDSQRASEVVHRLRSLSMKRMPQELMLDVRDVVRETLALAAREIANKHVQVKLDLDCTLALLGDRVQVQQVLLNLVMNAIAAMSDVQDRPRELSISVHDRGSSELLLCVRDAGTGIDAEKLDRMFEPFYTTKPTGLGLGLSISQRIVAAHGGRIWATSNDDHGLALWLVLPAVPSASAGDNGSASQHH